MSTRNFYYNECFTAERTYYRGELSTTLRVLLYTERIVYEKFLFQWVLSCRPKYFAGEVSNRVSVLLKTEPILQLKFLLKWVFYCRPYVFYRTNLFCIECFNVNRTYFPVEVPTTVIVLLYTERIVQLKFLLQWVFYGRTNVLSRRSFNYSRCFTVDRTYCLVEDSNKVLVLLWTEPIAKWSFYYSECFTVEWTYSSVYVSTTVSVLL